MQGKHEVACYDLCKIFLMDDANYPCWLVLVPQINDVKVRQLTPLSRQEKYHPSHARQFQEFHP